MGHVSPPSFVTLHGLRIKGMATAEALGVMIGDELAAVERRLGELAGLDLATFRAPRQLWQITVEGRTEHQRRLAADVAAAALELDGPYADFLGLNVEFKALCGRWQLRDGEPNDHADAGYDGDVIGRLEALHTGVAPVLDAMVRQLARLAPYGVRLAAAIEMVRAGDVRRFTGVLCESYHDVWMELHEDLLLTLSRERAAEGSF